MIIALVGTLSLAYVLQRALKFWNTCRAIGHWPGYRTVFFQGHPVGMVLPAIRGIAPGSNHSYYNKHKVFASIGWDAYCGVAAFPPVNTLVLADAAAIKEVHSSSNRFSKGPIPLLMFFGPNIVSSAGEEWKKYKKICAPAFSDRNNKLVWDETLKIVQEMFDVRWKGKDVITLDHAVEITLPIALSVIGVAGFGQTMSWKDEQTIPPGHKLSFQKATKLTISNLFLNLLIPDWLPSFTERLRTARLAFSEFRQYMSEMVDARQALGGSPQHDLFSNLLEANEGDDSGQKLTKDELIGNVFIFLLAGHETTAHTLCFAFALLALYPEEQDKLYEHISSVFSGSDMPTYSQMPLLTRSQVVLNETLRMFPPVPVVPKYVVEDTTLRIGNIQGQTTVLTVPAETKVFFSVAGLHYNPRYWKDPYTFNPDRFLQDWPRDAFLPFSGGPRACLGRRFFETEAIAVLSIIVSRYKIEIKEEPQFAGETFKQKCDRVLDAKNRITVTPTRVPLVFKRRDL
ncbi:cytochrome P450 [Pluteus cervinus]|uniref:Cytochrome P450 n=1 Tax=Pluteus cervinus TaxID=181527 RepID=A0ACD3A3M6_9AGAR|nr:cytochrome P450 [Pluteus cervinus]